FTTPQNWINDPNGLVYYNGMYHLFFQSNPFANVWGHMTWSHATSKDLIYWQHLPIAIKEENGIMAFSGSAVVDTKNSTGFSVNGSQPLVAIYTGHTDTLQTQNLAFSNNKGISWTKFKGNPVLNYHKKDFRDPNVFWYQPKQQWIMALSFPNEHQMGFFSSKNLKQWQQISVFGPLGDTSGVWECPDLMQVPIEGQPGKTKWVLFTSQNATMQYFVGEFDGINFKNESASNTIFKQDYGTDYYAAVAYHNTPNKQPIAIGWVNNWYYANDIPTTPWKGSMSLPRKLSVKKINNVWQLIQQPVNNITSLRGTKTVLNNVKVINNYKIPFKSQVFEMDCVLKPTNGETGIKIAVGNGHYFTIGYNSQTQTLFTDRTNVGTTFFNKNFDSLAICKAKLPLVNGKLKLHIYYDKSIVEIYANDNTAVFTVQLFPDENNTAIELYNTGEPVIFESINFWKMKSIWPNN
ncbi:MAG: glycoside hydrolase family 32 protein, partial [Deinococcales bacterium]|nr:glycoside hydrolase family 32 protein [Chitinophagaceae bacterium]